MGPFDLFGVRNMTTRGPLYGGQSQEPQPVQQQLPMGGNLGSNWKSILGDVIYALGADLATGKAGAGALAMPGLMDRRDQRAQLAQQQAQQNQSMQYIEKMNPSLGAAVRARAITPAQAMQRIWQERDAAQRSQQDQSGYFGNPVYLDQDTDGDGVPDGVAIGQLGKDGKPRVVDFGAGYNVMSPYDRRFQEGAGAEAGKTQANKASQFPTQTAATQELLGQIGALRNHPGRAASLGMIEGRLPNVFNNPNVADFRERVDQIKNGAFLSARQALKGGGAITDYEGNKAEAALFRAQQAKTEAQFDQALTEFEDHIIRMYEAYAKEAGQQPAPVGGGVDDLVNKYRSR